MTEPSAAKSPQIWPSVARLAATTAIFVFHYLGMSGQPQYRLDYYALLVFCLLSGYLANLGPRTLKAAWAVKRYFGVMIPHWLIFIVVILANLIVRYKHVSFASIVITMLGGTMFLSDPLYVITWYVTFVLLLYAYALLESLTTTSGQRLVAMVLGYLIFSAWFGRGEYFVAFLLGLRLADWLPQRRRSPAPRTQKLARGLFVLQRYCYPFFLLHGAVLVFFFNETPFRSGILFALAFVTSALFAVLVYGVAQRLQRRAVEKTVGVRGRSLGASPAV